MWMAYIIAGYEEWLKYVDLAVRAAENWWFSSFGLGVWVTPPLVKGSRLTKGF